MTATESAGLGQKEFNCDFKVVHVKLVSAIWIEIKRQKHRIEKDVENVNKFM